MKLSFPYGNSNAVLSIKAATIIFATLAIYHQDLTILGNETIQSELMNYILAIPFLLIYLLYRKRKILRAVISFETSTTKIRTTVPNEAIIGALLCVTAFLLYWQGSYTFQPLEYHIVTLPIFIAGCTLTMFNAKTFKILAFPIAFLLLLTPPPIETVYAAGSTLSFISSEAAYQFLKTIGLPVSQSTQYGTPVITIQSQSAPLTFAIDIACAGIYPLIQFSIFAIFVAYIIRGSLLQKTTTLLAGFPLIYALNITRIIIILLIGYQHGMETAMNAFHLFGGLTLIFLGTIILLFISEKTWKTKIFTTKHKTEPCPNCSHNVEKEQDFCFACGKLLKNMNIQISQRDIGKIAALLISASLITTLEVPVFALTQGPAEVIIRSPVDQLSNQATTQVLPEIPGYTLQFSYRDKKFEEMSQLDASLGYVYVPVEKTEENIWVIIDIAKSRSSLHPWEVCLITWPQEHGYQPGSKQLDLRDTTLIKNPPITARFFAFKHIKSNTTQVVLYWYETAPFNTTQGSQQKYVKISLITTANKPEETQETENRLLPIGEAIANHWQPIKTWSLIALTVAQNGAQLTIIPIFLLVMTLTHYYLENRERKKSNKNFYNKLTLEEDKLVLQAAHQATRADKPTGNTIASYFEKIAGKLIEPEQLHKKLNEAEKAGLIKREITSKEDEPALVWKSQIPSLDSRK